MIKPICTKIYVTFEFNLHACKIVDVINFQNIQSVLYSVNYSGTNTVLKDKKIRTKELLDRILFGEKRDIIKKLFAERQKEMRRTEIIVAKELEEYIYSEYIRTKIFKLKFQKFFRKMKHFVKFMRLIKRENN